MEKSGLDAMPVPWLALRMQTGRSVPNIAFYRLSPAHIIDSDKNSALIDFPTMNSVYIFFRIKPTVARPQSREIGPHPIP